MSETSMHLSRAHKANSANKLPPRRLAPDVAQLDSIAQRAQLIPTPRLRGTSAGLRAMQCQHYACQVLSRGITRATGQMNAIVVQVDILAKEKARTIHFRASLVTTANSTVQFLACNALRASGTHSMATRSKIFVCHALMGVFAVSRA
jgi:hypothetical protein